MNKYISVSHLRKILPQLPAIASQLGVPEYRYGEITLAVTDIFVNKMNLQSQMIDAHINGYIITFNDGRIAAVRREQWNMATEIPEFLRKLVY